MISYKSLYGLSSEPGVSKGDIMNFKTVNRQGFNATDSIDTRFFKLLFYFYNDDLNDNTDVEWYNGGSTGLLAPTWLDDPQTDFYKYNSAWAYLKNNMEDERADMLTEFVSLLSQISSESPWYFKQVEGVDEALTRENWMVPDERKKITITCLNDPIDHRISSLLSLYRSIVWSHTRKCEVLPANLRKFDMGLFVFSSLTTGLHVKHHKNGDNDWYNVDYDNNSNLPYASNYKYIEFNNCEISIDSIKSGFSGINNESGFEQEFKIDIYFDDCYENEYNPFILKTFGDFFVADSFSILARDEDGNIITPDSALADLYVSDDETLDTDVQNSYLNASEESFNQDIASLPAAVRKKIEKNKTKNQAVSKTIDSRLYPFGNVDEQEQQPSTKVYKNMNDMNIPTTKKDIKQKLKDEYNNLQNRMGNQIKYLKNINSSTVINKLKKEAEKTIERALVGDLGNFYGKGMGLRGVQMTAEQELRKQVNTISSKISGNINDAVTKIVRPVSEAVAKPIKKTIEFTGNLTSKIADSLGSVASDPLDAANTTSKMSPTTIQNLGSTGNSYASEADADEVGNFYYNSSEESLNNIGKNRLNQELGNMYQTNSMINNL